MEHQDSYGCRECSNGHKLRALARPSLRCQAGPPSAGRHRTAARAPASDHGSRLRRQRNPATGAGFRFYPGGSPQKQSPGTVAVRQGPLSQAQRSGTIVSPTQRLSAHLLPLRQTRRPFSWISQLRLNRRSPTIVLTRPRKRSLAEFFGTFWLVFGGCGSAVLAAAFPGLGIGFAGVALAFGLTVLTMAFAIGHISGCHLNPAVSVGLVVARRFPISELPAYAIAQVVGAI